MRRLSRSRPVSSIIGTSTDNLGSLRRYTTYLQRIQQAVDAALPDNAIGQARVADCNHQRLLLLVESGSWATLLRYQQTPIERSLAQRLRMGIKRIEVRVRPSARDMSKPAKPRYLSTNARQAIQACAGYVDNNPELSQALQRLATAGAHGSDS